MAASAVALFTVSRVRMGWAQQVSGSLIMGGGIAATHYIGMAAMRVPAMMEYNWLRVFISIVQYPPARSPAESIHQDPLTGLYNRRYLTEMLEREIRRAVRAKQSLGVIMLDLDHFKKFNDTYGHEAGDIVLHETASFLTKSIRVEDVVCRFGSEEFVIILPTAGVTAAHSRAERIRSKLRELTVLHQGQSLGMITVSVGVATLPQHGTSPKDLLEAAAAALYRAKREGRDRVVDAAPRPEPAPDPTTSEIALSAAK